MFGKNPKKLNVRLRTLLASNYLNLFGYSLFSPLYALFATHVGGNPKIVGTSYAVYTLVTALTLFIVGRLEDGLLNRAKAVVIAYFLLSAGAAAFLLVHTVPELFLVQVFNAIGSGILGPAWKATYGTNEDLGHEAKEWSFYDGGNMLATTIGAALGGFVLVAFGFSGIFVFMAGIQLIAALISLRLLRH